MTVYGTVASTCSNTSPGRTPAREAGPSGTTLAPRAPLVSGLPSPCASSEVNS
jgi:hypothetical protein